jgi:hypothetical protein
MAIKIIATAHPTQDFFSVVVRALSVKEKVVRLNLDM